MNCHELPCTAKIMGDLQITNLKEPHCRRRSSFPAALPLLHGTLEGQQTMSVQAHRCQTSPPKPILFSVSGKTMSFECQAGSLSNAFHSTRAGLDACASSSAKQWGESFDQFAWRSLNQPRQRLPTSLGLSRVEPSTAQQCRVCSTTQEIPREGLFP